MSDDHERSADARAEECNENRSQHVAVVDREWQILSRTEKHKLNDIVNLTKINW